MPFSSGLSSPRRPVRHMSPARRRTPLPFSTSFPSATPKSLVRADSPRSLSSSAQDGSASWQRRRSPRLVVSLNWLLEFGANKTSGDGEMQRAIIHGILGNKYPDDLRSGPVQRGLDWLAGFCIACHDRLPQMEF